MTYDVSARPCHSYQMQIPEQPKYGTEIFSTLSVSDLENLFCQWLHLGTLCPSGRGQKRTKRRGCKSRAIGPWENLGLSHLRLMGSLWHATDSYLPQLNANNSKQEVKQHGDQHDIPDGFHGYKHALNHMLYKKKTILMGRRVQSPARKHKLRSTWHFSHLQPFGPVNCSQGSQHS